MSSANFYQSSAPELAVDRHGRFALITHLDCSRDKVLYGMHGHSEILIYVLLMRKLFNNAPLQLLHFCLQNNTLR